MSFLVVLLKCYFREAKLNLALYNEKRAEIDSVEVWFAV